MGTGQAAKFDPARGVKRSITNYELRITNRQAFLRLILMFCALGALAGNSAAQDFEYLAQQIRAGNTEQKRRALFEIRNLRSAEASRIAVPALRDSDEIVRATAAFSVIFLPKEEAFNALAPNLPDKSELVRRETAYALGKIQNPSAVPLLIRTFQNKKEKSVEVKNAAVVALGEIGDAAAIDFLTQILRQRPKEDDDFLRRSAARSAGQIAQIIQISRSRVTTPENFLPDEYKLLSLEKYENLAARFAQFRTAVQVLTQVLQNAKEADDTRREAAFALGAIGDPAALPVLQTMAGSKDYYLAEISRESIEKLSTVDPAE